MIWAAEEYCINLCSKCGEWHSAERYRSVHFSDIRSHRVISFLHILPTSTYFPGNGNTLIIWNSIFRWYSSWFFLEKHICSWNFRNWFQKWAKNWCNSIQKPRFHSSKHTAMECDSNSLWFLDIEKSVFRKKWGKNFWIVWESLFPNQLQKVYSDRLRKNFLGHQRHKDKEVHTSYGNSLVHLTLVEVKFFPTDQNFS